MLIFFVVTIQLVVNLVLYGPSASNDRANDRANHDQSNGRPIPQTNSYDVLLKNTIHYDNLPTVDDNGGDGRRCRPSNSYVSKLQAQIDNMQSEITTLESKSQNYADDPRFFPFVVRDSRHLAPVQIDPNFHVFDYVDLTQAKQPKSKHSQLFHNARLVVDEVLEAKAVNATNQKRGIYAEPHEAPCQEYSIGWYRQKILQVFSYVLRKFPSVEYYFYVEADNDLYVPMTMVRDLALNKKRYFINTGTGFLGWIMS